MPTGFGAVAVHRLNVGEGEPAAGQRAGLVGADDVDVADGLDGVGLLHQCAAPGDAGGAADVGDGDEEEQSVGHQAREHRRGLHESQHRGPLEQGLRQDRAAHQQDQEDEQAHHQVDAPLQRGLRGGVGAGGEREAAGVAVGADALGALQALAARARAAREQQVADGLGDRVGLTGEQGFVDLHPGAGPGDRDDGPVDDDLLARPDPQHVADHDLGRQYLPFGAVA